MPFLVKRSSSVDPEDDDDERALPPGIDSPLDVDGGRRPYGEVASSGTRGDDGRGQAVGVFVVIGCSSPRRFSRRQ
jgi:hypothetical protein